ncbi:DOPA 4,5-dioxygenase family protein [Pelagibius litoralis]|uniref:DOPA 4,5-dioxygenase family protein n=2 Tax=Pelagibius litoralis TaxID=374515 RepID=A0A967F192_9PROT|nr:DOPA 4,5-dioxygenase family protein [Pelagibius litoralis]
MPLQTIDAITGYHAHVYYDAETKAAAAELREAMEANFAGLRMGRWHDRPVGPHPCWSYQVAFEPEMFASLVPWLALNRGDLVIFLHPETGDAVPDHRDHALWLGAKLELNLDALR